MKQRNIFTNGNHYIQEPEDEGILAKTGNMISSFFLKVRNSINPFKEDKYVENPYDINSINDPSNYLNYIESNKNDFYTSPSTLQNENNQLYGREIKRNNINNITINNNKNEILNKEENEYFSFQYLCNIYPNLQKEIFQEIKKPSYMPNEQIFQEAKKFVYENLVKKYQILKPKTELNNFIESTIILSIQLVNKYNIDKHYEYLINNKKCEYKLIIDVPEIIKKYYGNKEKDLLLKDRIKPSQKTKNIINKELFDQFLSKGNNRDDTFDISNENRIICQTPRTKRNYIDFVLNAKENFEYLGARDKMIISIFYDCLLHREEELRRYEKVVETTNNMFKFICNENEKLKDEISQKDKKLEKFSQEVLLKDFKNKDYEQKLKNYKNEIKELKKKNKFENLQKTLPIINSYINNQTTSHKSSNLISFGFKNGQSSNLDNNNNNKENNILSDNKNLETNKFGVDENIKLTVKKPFEFKNNNNLFTFGNKNEISTDKRNIFETINNISSSEQFKEKEKQLSKTKDSSFILNLNNQTQNIIDSKKIKKNDESKKGKLIVQESTEKKEDNNKKEEIKKEYNIFASIVTGNNNSSDKQSEEKNRNNVFLSDNKNNDNKINFGFKENKKKEEDKNIEKQNNKDIYQISKINEDVTTEKNKEINNIEEKKEKIANNKMKEENLTEEINKKQENNLIITKNESLNNPNNPFLSTVNVCTNIKSEFNPNILKDDKEKNNNIFKNETRSTIDSINAIITPNENQSFNNSIINTNNNPFIQNKTDLNTTNNFLNTNNNLENKIPTKNNSIFSENPFLPEKTLNNNTFNINNINNQTINSANNSSQNINLFSNISNNSSIPNNISFFKSENNINDNILNNQNFSPQTDNPFLANNNSSFIQSNGINNNSSSGQSLFSTQLQTKTNFSNNNIQNPFASQINNNNNSSNKNPFISNNNVINTNTNPFIVNNNNTSSISSNINPFIGTNNINSNNSNPFIVNNNGSSSTSNPFIGNNNIPSNGNPFIGNNNNNSSSTNINPFNTNNLSTIQNNNINGNNNSLFKFQTNPEKTNSLINPFLNCQDGFQQGVADSSCGFSLGVKTNNNSSNNSIFGNFPDNKPKKTQGFFN